MNSKIEEVVKMAKEMLGDDVNVEVFKVTPKTEETKEEETGTPIENSLITSEEKECVKLLVEAFDNLMNVHKIDGKFEFLHKAMKNDYSMLQFLMYSDHIRDAIDAIKGLHYVCNHMTKEDVDEVAKQNDTTTKEMVMVGMMHALEVIKADMN